VALTSQTAHSAPGCVGNGEKETIMSIRRTATGAAVVLALSTAGWAQQADRQLAFAEQLHRDGEEAFALLEYKRFLFHNGRHAQAVKAGMAAARLYIGYVGDIGAAKRTLNALLATNNAPSVRADVTKYLQFIEVNSDYNAKPLMLFVAATEAEGRSDHDGAVKRYADLLRDFPKARLADDALFQHARLLLEKLNRPAEAGVAFKTLIGKHPTSPHAPEAYYYYAYSLEQQHGYHPSTVQAYQRVAAVHPKSDAALRARQRLAALQRARQAIKRQFDRKFVRTYQLLQAGYLVGPHGPYIARVKVPANLSEAEVKATMEDALLAYYQKRAKADDSVQIDAYYDYPNSRAGWATWRADQPPQYTVTQQKPKGKGKDVIKDVLIDILKGI